MRKAVCLEFYNDKIQCTKRGTKEGRCEKHQIPPFYRNMRNERLPEGWNFIRAEAFRVYGTTCYLCGKDGADSIDHLVNNDDNSIANLRPAHQNVEPYCHRTKTAAEGHAAQQAARPALPGATWERVPLRETPPPK